MAACTTNDGYPTPTDHRIARAVAVCEQVLRLPAVPTLDWCDQAAACFLGMVGTGAATVAILNIGRGGIVEHVHASGAACGPIQGAVPPIAERIDLRCGVEKLLGERWTINAGELITEHAELLCPEGRGGTAHAPTWEWLGDAPMLAGITPLAGSGASVAVYLGSQSSPFTQNDVAMLTAVLGPLSRAATRALGQGSLRASDWLSVREQEVLNDLLLGMTVKEIAESMSRSPHTIHDHVKSLHRKLHASTRGELVARALGYATPAAQPAAFPAAVAG